MLLPRKTDNFETLKLRFSKSLKDLPLGQFLGSSNSRRYHGILKLLVATLKSEVWKQNCVWLFHYFHFEKNYDVLKPKSPYMLLNKNIKVVAFKSAMSFIIQCFQTKFVLKNRIVVL